MADDPVVSQHLADLGALSASQSKYECLVNAVNQVAPEKAQQIFALAAKSEPMQLEYDRVQREGEALYELQNSGAHLTPEQQERLNDDMGMQ